MGVKTAKKHSYKRYLLKQLMYKKKNSYAHRDTRHEIFKSWQRNEKKIYLSWGRKKYTNTLQPEIFERHRFDVSADAKDY
jgi:hypothetical protein